MRRILLKLSGEALAGDKKTGFDEETVRAVALQAETFGVEEQAKILTEPKLIRLECWQL